jgi:hypothetical protein
MSWKQALALGLCSVGEVKKEPVAYLYNGVRLPKIPEVEGYKYAFLRVDQYGHAHVLHTYVPMTTDETGKYLGDYHPGVGNNRVYYRESTCYAGSDSWFTTAETSFVSKSLEPTWLSYDIVNPFTGEVVFAKSPDPIPVYE